MLFLHRRRSGSPAGTAKGGVETAGNAGSMVRKLINSNIQITNTTLSDKEVSFYISIYTIIFCNCFGDA
jgi:hypothetical protein